MALDPDDPRPPYVQVASALRAAILTKKLTAGERLPSQNALTTEYGVSRATVQRALRDLQDEGLIVARQGSGAFVRSRTERPMELRPHIEQAFESETVTLDFAGFSGETLNSAIREPIDKIRSGRLTPRNIAVRMLVPDTRKPQAIPHAANPQDAEAARVRAHGIMRRNTRGIVDAVTELESLGLVERASVQIRLYDSTPAFKLYVLNEDQVFFGFYPVTRNTVKLETNHAAEILDVFGFDTVLFSYSRGDDPDKEGARWVEQSRQWFESIWSNIGEDFNP